MTTPEPGSAAMERLVQTLRNVTEDDAYALPWTFGVTCREAADAIETLTRERDEAREALKPFAQIADMEENAKDGASVIVNISRCRNARSVLRSEPTP